MQTLVPKQKDFLRKVTHKICTQRISSDQQTQVAEAQLLDSFKPTLSGIYHHKALLNPFPRPQFPDHLKLAISVIGAAHYRENDSGYDCSWHFQHNI